MLKINGKQTKFQKNQTIQEFLALKGLEPEKIVVELNAEILQREQWKETVLQENDSLEIISFVGGG